MNHGVRIAVIAAFPAAFVLLGISVVGKDEGFVEVVAVFGEGQHQRVAFSRTGSVRGSDVEIASVGQVAEKRFGVVVRKAAFYGRRPRNSAVGTLHLPQVAVIGFARTAEQTENLTVVVFE